MAIVLKFVYENAYSAMVLIVEGKATDSSLVHDMKAPVLIVESWLGRSVAESSDAQP